jgi:hypothetical protein
LIGTSTRFAVGDAAIAKGFALAHTPAPVQAQQGKRQGKRGRAKESAKNDLVFHNESTGGATEESGSTTTLDVQLVISAVTRILGGNTAASSTQDSSASTTLVGDDKTLVVALASDLTTAICESSRKPPW